MLPVVEMCKNTYYHVMSCHAHVMPCHVMSCHVIYHTFSEHLILRFPTLVYWACVKKVSHCIRYINEYSNSEIRLLVKGAQSR